MKKELNLEWSRNLAEMRTTLADDDRTRIEKIARMAEYVRAETDGSFSLDKYSGYIVQEKKLPWGYVFDVIKNAPNFGFIVPMALPPRFKVSEPKPERGKMFAYYNKGKDAVLFKLYTGERREDLAGYDGWGREPDELEVVEGLRDRDGNWIEELSLKWE